MLVLHLYFEDGCETTFSGALPISIGRTADRDLRLKSWRVARHHANLEQRAAGIFVNDLGALSGTFVNGQRIAQYGPLNANDEIIIGPCLIRLDGSDNQSPGRQGLVLQADTLPVTRDDNAYDASSSMLQPVCLKSGVSLDTDQPAREAQAARDQAMAFRMADTIKHGRRLHSALLDALDLRRRDIATLSDEALRSEASDILATLIAADEEIPSNMDREQLLKQVVDEAVGLGPLEPLLADSDITEIMVNRHDEIFIESQGRLYRHESSFSSEQAVLGVIERIVSPLGRRIDESSPMVDARLRDGSRVNAIIPPVALRGSSITIRKFPVVRPEMQDLLRVGALDKHMSQFLTACVIQRKNMVVSGGTGSGKTTLLNILSGCIPAGERIVTIEDAAELQLGHQHLVALEARPPNLEGRGTVSIRDLVRNALRMRPDRIVVGECRGAEAFDMLAAMNTGHEGSLTTLHANSPRDALGRLETMILMAGMDLPLAAVREHVASSIDIIVQQARLSSGRRIITSIVQVTGQESTRIQLQELFRYRDGPPAVFEGCGVLPDELRLDVAGLTIDTFNQRTEISKGSGFFQAGPDRTGTSLNVCH